MKTKFSRILGVGLSFMLVASFMVFAAPVSADTLDWGEEDLPVVSATFVYGKMIQPVTDILGFSAANDGKTLFAVVQAEPGAAGVCHPTENSSQEVWRTGDAGKTWWSYTPTSGNTSRVAFVAVSPDDPSIVIAAGLDTVDGDNTAWISLDKGETWSSSNISGELSGNITCLAISEERDDIRWVAVGSDNPSKCLTVARAEAFASWVTAGGTSANWTGFDSANATSGVLAVAFSPEFGNDDTLLAVTSLGGATTWLQAAVVDDAWADCEFNPTDPFANYPAEIAETGQDTAATQASISLPDEYWGLDLAERIAYIGTSDGVFRMDDTDCTKLTTGNRPYVAYNSEENKLLVGRADSGRVDMSDNPDSGSPSFTRPSSMKTPSGEGVSGVAWVGETMMCSTKDVTGGVADDESAISISTDARSWNQLSLIDTDLSSITDVAVSEDGSKIYIASQSSAGTDYSIWRYASGWERVLCDEKATGQTGVIIRLAPGKPEVVFVALVGTEEIRRSTDSGETWKQSRADLGPTYGVKDMAVKDDKIVFVTNQSGYVSTSKDGGRTFADYIKCYVYARHMIVAPNGDVLVVGSEVLVSPAKINVALSTDDGATWKRMAVSTGLTEYTPEEVANPMLVAADTDYATNDLIYVALTDGDDANLLRWKVGGDYEEWQDIGTAYYPLTKTEVIYGLACHDDVLYLAYCNTSDNTSGFASTVWPTIKRTDVTWGGGPDKDAELGSAGDPVRFTLKPQSLQVSSGSAELWAIDTRSTDTAVDRLWSYRDILAKVEAPTITGPDDKYLAGVDQALQKVNPIKFKWDEVNPDVKYMFRIGSNAAVTKHYVSYYPGTSEFITVSDGTGDNAYPFGAGETYYWKVRVWEPTVSPWSETWSFTIEKVEVVVAEPPVVTVTPPEVTVAAPPAPEVKVTVQPAPPAPAPVIPPAIPMWTLWTIIVIGAVLVIAVIVLIVRTRRVV